MAIYAHDCPHCGATRAPLVVRSMTPAKKLGGVIVATNCPFCEGPVTLVVVPIGKEIVQDWSGYVAKFDLAIDEDQFPPIAVFPEIAVSKVPAGIPDGLARIYRQALDNMRSGNVDAAGVMLRKTLEVALQIYANEETSKTLATRVRSLAQAGKVPIDVADWMDEIRGFGNVSAHDLVEPTAEELREIHGFTEMLLRYLFTMPKMMADRRLRKENIAE